MPRASGKGRHVLGAAVAVWVASAAVGVGTAAADTFTYTGGEQSYTVSAGITGLHVVLVGAAGASETVPDLSAAGGHGARLTADVPVPAGTATLYVEVGGTGTSANPPSLAYTATGGSTAAATGRSAAAARPISGPSRAASRTLSARASPSRAAAVALEPTSTPPTAVTPATPTAQATPVSGSSAAAARQPSSQDRRQIKRPSCPTARTQGQSTASRRMLAHRAPAATARSC